MLIGVYADPHITKNMRSLQDTWEVTATKSIYHMYDKFDEMNVELVVCLGDFFDAPKLEAKHLNFILPILNEINSKTYPTYILLGNHEADSSDTNILEYLSIYENIHPITTSCIIEDMCFIPYYDDPTIIDISQKIVFTHHDIYGSSLASGKVKAFFGIDPCIFKEAKLVMNGHVHLKSKVTPNIVNAGSLLVSQQGELRLGEYPSYYVLDTKTAKYKSFDNIYSMIYLTIDIDDIEELREKDYDYNNIVLKVEYEGEIPSNFINTAHTSWKKKISSIDNNIEENVVRTTNFDMRNYLINYIKNDSTIEEHRKEDYIKLGVDLLG